MIPPRIYHMSVLGHMKGEENAYVEFGIFLGCFTDRIIDGFASDLIYFAASLTCFAGCLARSLSNLARCFTCRP